MQGLLAWSISVAALAAAKSVENVGANTTSTASNVLVKTNPPVHATEEELTTLRFYAQHAAAAYCNYNAKPGSLVSCRDCPTLERTKPTVVASTTGHITGIGAYVALDDERKEIVVSVRGSSNIRNWLADLNFPFVGCNWGPDCLVHAGFHLAWKEIKDDVKMAVNKALPGHPDYRLVITGHSLGGAVATLLATQFRHEDCDVDEYTYGSPRVGNMGFVESAKGKGTVQRVTHEADPVPRLPPLFLGYRHVSPEYWLNGGVKMYDYPIDKIIKCFGSANVDCNASTTGLDIRDHSWYFLAMSTCENKYYTTDTTHFVDDDEFEDMGNTTTVARLKLMMEKDREFGAQVLPVS